MQDRLDWPAIAQNPDSLNDCAVAELRAMWARFGPKTPPSPHRAILLRELAFLVQSGTARRPKDNELLIRAAMKAASVIRSPEDKPAEKPGVARMPAPKAVEDLPVGTVLTRQWRKQIHQVTVLAGGWFQYQGRSYKSLSLVANHITGTHWSGPRFFGLHRIREQRHG